MEAPPVIIRRGEKAPIYPIKLCDRWPGIRADALLAPSRKKKQSLPFLPVIDHTSIILRYILGVYQHRDTIACASSFFHTQTSLSTRAANLAQDGARVLGSVMLVGNYCIAGNPNQPWVASEIIIESETGGRFFARLWEQQPLCRILPSLLRHRALPSSCKHPLRRIRDTTQCFSNRGENQHQT
ncbi:hypothetical protein B9Z19DRAFT_577948 [Tuber borchii]|uniref:Uncharacterized protein n=1 Tax=Tuber borchii TaxID=42251 RepID=A0A2T6ZCE2_TUBBO|nr:hypothetical protein B9Z19DRAFT_577948 [Tuber borchii]